MNQAADAAIVYRDIERVPVDAAGFAPDVQAVLQAVNDRVAGAESLAATMDYLFDATAAHSPCDRLGLAFTSEDQERVTAHWARVTYEPLLLHKGYSEPLQGSSLEAVINQRQVRIINDLDLYLKRNPKSHSTQLVLREGVRSSMTCPLYVEGRVVGLLFRSSTQPYAYRDEHIAMHLAIAERLSQAVEKAYRIERLTEANQAYMEMLGFVSHELKNPLASVVMDGEVLLGGYVGDLEMLQADKVRRMVQKCEFLLDLVREYLDLAKLEQGDLSLRVRGSVDFVKEVIAPAVDLTQAALERKQARITIDPPDELGPIECDPDLMRIVMVNLISNAAKYAYEQGQIRVAASKEGGHLHVSVWNEGVGFTEEQRSALFRKFSRLQTPELLKEKGTGVGLYTTWRIVRLHGGKITAESEHKKWAQFCLAIPQPLTTISQESR